MSKLISGNAGSRPDWLGSFKQRLKGGFSNRLGWRFVTATILASSVLAVFMTSLQLYVDYRDQLTLLDGKLSKIESLSVPAVTEAFWLKDEAQVNGLLTALAQHEHISDAQVIVEGEIFSQAGDAEAKFREVLVFPLTAASSGVRDVSGALLLKINHDPIYQTLIRRGKVILATNAVKATLIASVILFIYQTLIGQHLARLSAAISAPPTRGPPTKIVLDRRAESAGHDDLTILVDSLNSMRAENSRQVAYLREAYDEIAENRAEREAARDALFQYSVELEAANHKLARANEDHVTLTRTISQDVAPAAEALHLGLTRLLQRFGGEQRGAVHFAAIAAANGYLRHAVSDLLIYTSAISDDDEAQPVDLNSVLSDLSDTMAADLEEQGASIEWKDLPSVIGHRSQLVYLFRKLIQNFLKADPSRADVAVSVGAVSAKDGRVQINVFDPTLCLLQECREVAHEIFNLSVQLPANRQKQLGFAICRQIVENHGGTLRLSVPSSQGATWEMILPLDPAGKSYPFV